MYNRLEFENYKTGTSTHLYWYSKPYKFEKTLKFKYLKIYCNLQ